VQEFADGHDALPTGGSASSSQPPAPDQGSLPVMGGAYTQ
jgi:hypothetical protein